MKRILLITLLSVPAFCMAQNFVGSSVDSATSLIKQVEKYSGTSLQLRQRSDSMENYLFRDKSGFISVKLNMKNEKELQGTTVINKPAFIEYITIKGTPAAMENLFNTYLKKCTPVIEFGKLYIHTLKWDAQLEDGTIINKEGEKMPGKFINIEKHNN